MKAFKKISLMVFSLLLVFVFGCNNKLFAENINDNGKKLVYVENIFYDENGKSANGWYNDGKEMYFFQNGKKFTGFTKDKGESKYFVNGKYGTGIYKDVLYKNGVKSKGRVYVDGIFYGDDAKPVNWWYNDGNAWYFFKNGKKHTGLAKDGNGEMQFVNGKYANCYIDKILYREGKPANWWYDDGSAWYFFKDGKKFTGIEKDASGYKYFVKGKYGSGIYKDVLYKDGVKSAGRVYVGDLFYGDDAKPANWWYNDGSAWYFFKDGKKYTGLAKDGNGEMQFVKGKYANCYIDKIFYREGKIANWWCDYGNTWYFFQNGKKHTGYGIDDNGKRYFVDGKYANGEYDGIIYKDGLKSKGQTYINEIFYDENLKPANWWYDDGSSWYFFKDGKKHTGLAKDGNGEMQFVNGKYANCYIDKIFYREGKVADWWCDDGTAWFFFKDGKKFTGHGIDGNGKRYFINGKYANGIYEEKLYKDGLESEGKTYINEIFYDGNKLPANGWYDDGYDWFFFKDGKKHTGKAVDGNGELDFVEGKYRSYRNYYMASKEVQMRILNAAYNTSSPGRNLCAKWVSRVYQNAGLGYLGGNANELYRKYTFTSDISKLKVGMIVAVESSSSGSWMGRKYGHAGIYIGDGKVMESIGYKRIVTLEYWIETCCKHHPVGFGYPPSVEK